MKEFIATIVHPKGGGKRFLVKAENIQKAKQAAADYAKKMEMVVLNVRKKI